VRPLRAGAALASGDSESRDEASYTQAHRSQATVSEDAARATAQGRHTGSVVDAHLQNEGQVVWELVIADGCKRSEVQVDAASGRMTSCTDHTRW